jgi:HD-GYP domain-containing protein (c-di-GMP phosphodiesterase class II)
VTTTGEITASPRLADLLAALSVVTDLGHGQPPEDAMRTCLLATRLAECLGLPTETRVAIYYSSLLRYIGCTAYAHEEAALFGGDEIAARAALVARDMTDPRDVAGFFLHDLGKDASPVRRVRIVGAALPRAARALPDLAASNCEVGASMARRLGMGPLVQQALLQLYERWDGKGAPRKLRGEDLVLPMRVAQLAGLAIAALQSGSADHAVALVRRHGGRDLDPNLAAEFERHGHSLLREVAVDDPWSAVVEAEPAPHLLVDEGRLDEVGRAFADMVDLKLPFTRGHSTGVAELAQAAAREAGLPPGDVVAVHRAGLFHDLGRLAVPNGIWEKRGAFSGIEWERVRLHPYQTERILARSPALTPLARLAGMHHERQDGSGYHRQSAGAAIPMTARLLAAADSYQAMTQERPHRPALSSSASADTLRIEAGSGRLDSEAVDAVLAGAGHRTARARHSWPSGLSDREVEVLQLLARGASYKGVASVLYISPRTAAHHVQHIYDKIGVSTRAGATMFAMEHELVAYQG